MDVFLWKIATKINIITMIISYHANNHLVVKPWRKLLVTATRWRSHVHQGFALNRWETTVVSFYFQNFLSQIFVNFSKQFFLQTLSQYLWLWNIFELFKIFVIVHKKRPPDSLRVCSLLPGILQARYMPLCSDEYQQAFQEKTLVRLQRYLV